MNAPSKKFFCANKYTLENGLEYKNYCYFPSLFFSLVQEITKVPTFHFCSHYETPTTCNHSNVPSLTVKMPTQSTVILCTEQHLVEVMICTSLTMPTLTEARIVTLATHTSHQLSISMALNKPSRCLLVASASHQQKLKFFIE